MSTKNMAKSIFALIIANALFYHFSIPSWRNKQVHYLSDEGGNGSSEVCLSS